MHQLRIRPFKSFWDEPKTHPPLPKVFGFFSLFFAPKFVPPTYLPPTYLPLLPNSPHFAFTPSSELDSAGSKNHHCQNLGAFEMKPRTNRPK